MSHPTQMSAADTGLLIIDVQEKLIPMTTLPVSWPVPWRQAACASNNRPCFCGSHEFAMTKTLEETRVEATGKRKPASRATNETSTSTPSAMAWAREYEWIKSDAPNMNQSPLLTTRWQ
jgi:hypothetical protein